MMICILQAPQYGWETWFSCVYGMKMAEVETRAVYAKPMSLVESIRAAKAVIVENQEKLAKAVRVQKR